MADNEFIKALEDYIKENEFEYFHSNMMSEYPLIKKSLNLINRQQAEIEKLERVISYLEGVCVSIPDEVRTKAIKELISYATALCYKEFENDLEVAHTFASILIEAQKEMA